MNSTVRTTKPPRHGAASEPSAGYAMSAVLVRRTNESVTERDRTASISSGPRSTNSVAANSVAANGFAANGASANSDVRWKRARLRAIILMGHRYLGLATAVFLVVAGLTGSALAFRHELEAAVSPGLLRAEAPSPQARPRDPLDLREALERQLPAEARVTYVPLMHEPGKSLLFFVEGPSGAEQALDDEFFVDPYTGKVLGSRRWGAIEQGIKNLVPFIYRLHFELALGTVGSYLLGAIALVWTFDCFAGAYLTLPTGGKRSRGKPGKSWLRRWKPAWLLNTAKLFSFVFTWHRASGLWVWGMLLVFAWSAVGMNLTQVYNPVMGAVFGIEERPFDQLKALETPRTTPRLSWVDARERGKALMSQQASRRKFSVIEERTLGYFANRGMYQYRVRSSLDISERYPGTVVWFDGDTGELSAFSAPTGQHAGNTITSWINNLHFGSIAAGGLAYRIFVSLMGFVVTGLSITGTWIWWRKRKRRASTLGSRRAVEPDFEVLP